MPSTLIEVRRQYSDADEVALIDAVHAALVSAFRIPPGDKHVRLVVHAPHRFAVPPGLAHPEFATIVNIDCFAGRSLDAKRNLYRALVTNLEPFGIPANHITILVRDFPAESWGIRGGQAATDIDLGFKVNV
ncbi:tautomerase family protein [Kribbella sp. NPDC026611]|uniref:tautomerase family protein n=1 Tax=Kribbella sp. NPDC026611 TaxID=3154911 RepID=UPI0033C1192B